jgi:hypothetical protein
VKHNLTELKFNYTIPDSQDEGFTGGENPNPRKVLRGGNFLLYSEWDPVSISLLKAIRSQEVPPGFNMDINLVSSFELPEAYGMFNEVSYPVLVLQDGTVEDYPARIWDALSLR